MFVEQKGKKHLSKKAYRKKEENFVFPNREFKNTNAF